MEALEKVDSFWETYNTSRCKTAMLLITIIVFLGVTLSELLGTGSSFLREVAIIVVGYWTGRSSKAKDNSTGSCYSTNSNADDENL